MPLPPRTETAVTEMLPLAVLLAKIPSAPCPVTVPVAVIARFPVPAFSARIPLAEPVTAFTVRVTVVP